LEPEGRDGREHAALVADRLLQHDVEGGQPVGGHQQQLVLPHLVDVSDLAGVQVREGDGHSRRSYGLAGATGPVANQSELPSSWARPSASLTSPGWRSANQRFMSRTW